MTRIEAIVSLTCATLITTLLVCIGCRPTTDWGQCRVRLGWLGVGLEKYRQDHKDRLPWQVSSAEGGSLAYVSDPSAVFRHYLAASDYLDSPSLLRCPQDDRIRATSWEGLRDSNISYFLNVAVQAKAGASVLAGDRYLTTNSTMLSGLFEVKTTTHLRWTEDFHDRSAYLLFLDGSVAHNRTNLVSQFFLTGDRVPNRLAIP